MTRKILMVIEVMEEEEITIGTEDTTLEVEEED